MEIRHLRYLVAVAEADSLTAAAERLHLAQPALSRQIHDLEREVKGDLFLRERRGTRLTVAGEAVVRTARYVLAEIESAIDRARQTEQGLVGKCVIGAGRLTIWNGSLASLIECVREDYPGIELVVDERAPRAQWQALSEGRVDVVLDSVPASEWSHVVAEQHSSDVMDSIAVAREHPLARLDSVSLGDLQPYTWVRPAPSIGDEPTRLLQAALLARGFIPASTRLAANDDALRMLVRAGIGWSALPHSSRESLPAAMVAIPISDFAVPFSYVFCHRRGESRPLVRTVLGAIRRSIAARQGARSSGVVPQPVPAEQCCASRIELRHLRYFCTVAHSQSIGVAADQLNITQPALSRQMRDLEDEVGVPLLHRMTRGIDVTPAGTSFADDAVRILRAADAIPEEVRRAQRGESGRCIVALAPSPLIWDMMARVITACDAAQLVDIGMEDIQTPEQVVALTEGRIDLALGHSNVLSGPLSPAIVSTQLRSDRLNTALLSQAHPLAGRDAISLRELARQPFLFVKRSFSPAFYDQVMALMSRAQFTPHIDAAYDGSTTIWALTAQGLGWSLGSSSQQVEPPAGLIGVPLLDFEFPWGCELFFRRDESRDGVLGVIRALLAAAHDAAHESASVERAVVAAA